MYLLMRVVRRLLTKHSFSQISINHQYIYDICTYAGSEYNLVSWVKLDFPCYIKKLLYFVKRFLIGTYQLCFYTPYVDNNILIVYITKGTLFYEHLEMVINLLSETKNRVNYN